MDWDGINRRRYIRVKFPYTIHIYTSEGHAISTYTENVSEGGVLVVVKEQLRLSSIVDLEIYLKRDPTVCKGRVSWTKEKKSRYLDDLTLCIAGIEFCDISDVERLFIRERAEEICSIRRQCQKNLSAE